MNFIKKIVDKKIDNLVHLQFQKFSKGEFKDRAVVSVKKVKNKFTINTSAEFANEFVRILAEKLGKAKTKITGSIISTNDLKSEIEFVKVSQFQGVKNYSIDKEMSGEEILRLLNKFPKNFFALSLSFENYTLKIKPKAPKSGKPGKGDKDVKPDFCKLITEDENIGKSFVFEKNDFKEAEIKHDFVIESINVPANLKNSEDYAKIREESTRKGKIIRHSKIDSVESKKDFEFEA
ncbi:MAG: hypothetical protein WC812_04370 [Candidatus Pacearchaeota archaeon]|jgi:hypothetical protein